MQENNRIAAVNGGLMTLDERHPLLYGVEKPVIETLQKKAEFGRLRAGEVLWGTGRHTDNVLFVQSGTVQVFAADAQGQQVSLELFKAPALIQPSIYAGSSHYATTIATLEPATVCNLPESILVAACQKSPLLAQNVLRDHQRRLQASVQRQSYLAFGTVADRLAYLLLTYADAFGLPVEEGILIRVPMSQFDLANHIGATRRSIARAVKVLSKAGILGKRQKNLVLRDYKKLQKQIAHPPMALVHTSTVNPMVGRSATTPHPMFRAVT